MNNSRRTVLLHTRSLIAADALRPSLLMLVGQTLVAFLGAVLITNGLLI
ncbi:hypothetical protein [Salinibacter sp. 10B]|nr:hypothetical protein [Salinibacter sp. 10B]